MGKRMAWLVLALGLMHVAADWEPYWDRPPTQSDLAVVHRPLLGQGDELILRALKEKLKNFHPPIADYPWPPPAVSWPGTWRPYRQGRHQGLDLAPGGGPDGRILLSCAAGLVVRADHDYEEMSPAERDALVASQEPGGPTNPVDLDKLHGRQIWIVHSGGLMTRYSHVEAIDPKVVRGAWVRLGQALGLMGNSGTDSASEGMSGGLHLHFEIHHQGRPFWEHLDREQIGELLGEVFQRAASNGKRRP